MYRLVPEIVVQSEGMSQLMGHREETEVIRHHQGAAVLRPPPPDASRRLPVTLTKGIGTEDDEVDVRIEIEGLLELGNHRVPEGVVVVAEGMLSVDAMHQRLALGIGFDAEGPVAVAVGLHLLAVEGLTLPDHRLHRIDHVGAVRPVVGQEVDHSHGARFACVQIRKPLGRGARMIAPRALVVVERAEMHTVSRRGRSVGGERTEKINENRQTHQFNVELFQGACPNARCKLKKRLFRVECGHPQYVVVL